MDSSTYQILSADLRCKQSQAIRVRSASFRDRRNYRQHHFYWWMLKQFSLELFSLEQFCRTCYRKVGEPAKRKPKPKHPLKLHVWAGISRHGSTKIWIFEGIMAADLYNDILWTHLLPFITEKLQNHHVMQDNNLQHTSRVTKVFFEEQGINWWPTPPLESPDLNPIENLWHELKFFLEMKVKPRSKQELIDGIKFWRKKVDTSKCVKYIDHVLHKAIPTVVELPGAATKC